MDCTRIVFSRHALRRIFERNIGMDDVIGALNHGTIVVENPDDKPYPSVVILGTANHRRLHVVVGRDPASGLCVIVTVYVPDPTLWERGRRRRRPR
ncbi:MAG: DUF4258 domain-containing protein [Candidatus Lambdaproteobacteria bacterium]|nr:DUF4258 domain-containing protein [Candidatus Lambdaproteobacteria bacterium]